MCIRLAFVLDVAAKMLASRKLYSGSGLITQKRSFRLAMVRINAAQVPHFGLSLVIASACAIVFGGCGGPGATGAAAPPSQISAAAFTPSTYATVSGVRGSNLTIALYPAPLSPPQQSLQEPGGAALRFDPTGVLWFDQIGDFIGYRPDGSTAGTIYGIPGSLLSFAPNGEIIAGAAASSVGLTSCCYAVATYSVDYSAGALQPMPGLVGAIATSDFPCSVAADSRGHFYVSTCKSGPFADPFEAVAMYSSSASGTAQPLATNLTSSGPVAVDRADDLFAVYGDNIGVWLAGDFGSNPPDREVPIGTITPFDLAVDAAGDIFVTGRATSEPALSPTSLYYIPKGAGALTMLQSNVSSVATPF